jgi:hypothetical protein
MSTNTTGAGGAGKLRWAVRPSFVRYVQVMAGGSCEAVDGAEADAAGVFDFPLTEAAETGGNWVLTFGGGARFRAHQGFLDVDLHGLRLRVMAAGAALDIAVAAGGYGTIATMHPVTPVTENGLMSWSGLVPLLTEGGTAVFGGVYPAGSDFGSLDVAVPLSS